MVPDLAKNVVEVLLDEEEPHSLPNQGGRIIQTQTGVVTTDNPRRRQTPRRAEGVGSRSSTAQKERLEEASTITAESTPTPMMGQIGTPAMLGVEDPTKIPTEEGAVLLRRATLQPHSLPNQAPWRR